MTPTSVDQTSSHETLSEAAANYLLAFADDEHMLGARHTSWIGRGPFLEEDLAFCSIAQDELGHAIALYEFLTDNVDHFALLRNANEYRSCDLAELECAEWHDALVRHWLYDRAEELRWGALMGSSNVLLAQTAHRTEREEVFHRAHAASFMGKIARSGDTESIDRIIESVRRILPIALDLWEPAEGESAAIAEGFATESSAELSARWESLIRTDIETWGLNVEWPSNAETSRLRRSDGFDGFLASLQEVITIDTTTQW